MTAKTDTPIKAGTARITKRRDYLRVAATGRKWVTPAFIVQAKPDSHDAKDLPRIGYTASKKVGGAVQRSKARRRLKEAAAQVLNDAAPKGWTFVLIARTAALSYPFEKLKKDLAWALAKLASNADIKSKRK